MSVSVTVPSVSSARTSICLPGPNCRVWAREKSPVSSELKASAQKWDDKENTPALHSPPASKIPCIGTEGWILQRQAIPNHRTSQSPATTTADGMCCTKLRTKFRSAGLHFLILALIFNGCAEYHRASPEGCRIAVALFSACSLRDERRLRHVSEEVRRANQSEQITQRETHWFNSIIESAKSGDWETAHAEIRSLLEAQIET